MDVAISGASGLVGSALVPALASAGHRPIRLVRRTPEPGADEIAWQPAEGGIDTASLEGIDAVIHLASAGIGDRRWNAAYRRTLATSRTEPTALLASTLASLARPPDVFLSASAIGYYGDGGDKVLTETSPAGEGFLADLVQGWEAATSPAADAGIRTACLRSGMVLSPAGGALERMLGVFRFGVGGRFGSGRQYQSWISIDDHIAAIVHLLTSDVAGAVNLTAPEPVTNAAFTKALGSVIRRPTVVPVPRFALQLVLGTTMATELLFFSQRIVPAVLTADGFAFAHTDITTALRAVLGKQAGHA